MIRVFSYGGGVQSTAALVLAAQGKINFQTFLFCNVGADSENPKTITYLHEVAKPFALAHGLEIIELQKTRRDGSSETIYQRLTRPGSRSIGIPVRMNGNGAPGRRSCTYDFKIAVVDKWIKEQVLKRPVESREDRIQAFLVNALVAPTFALAIAKSDAVHEHMPIKVQVGLGISLDEIERMKPNMDQDTVAWKENVFPLLTEVPRPLTRIDCMQVIASAGLAVPPQSACIFCPFHTLAKWQRMRQEEPDQFWRAADLEAFINRKRAALGLDPVWLCRKLKPLAEATTALHQSSLFDETPDACESGYCMV